MNQVEAAGEIVDYINEEALLDEDTITVALLLDALGTYGYSICEGDDASIAFLMGSGPHG